MTKTYISELISILDERIKGDSNTVIYLDAGHYKAASPITTFSLTSLLDALAFGKVLKDKYANSIKVVFGILIDNLGLECSSQACEVAGNQEWADRVTLHESLQEILQAKIGQKAKDVRIVSERAVKNRAIRRLRGLLKSDSPQLVLEKSDEEYSIFFKNHSERKIFLAQKKGDLINVHCPCIVAQHYLDTLEILRKKFHRNNNFITIDWCERTDKPNVESGLQALEKVFYPASIKTVNFQIVNVFYFDEEGLLSQLNYKNVSLSEVRKSA